MKRFVILAIFFAILGCQRENVITFRGEKKSYRLNLDSLRVMVENCDETCNCVSSGNKKTLFMFPECQVTKITFLFTDYPEEGLVLENCSLDVNGQKFWIIHENDLSRIDSAVSYVIYACAESCYPETDY